VAKPHIEVLVDWNDDGDFGDSDEDITSDVLSLSVDHFRDMETEYMDGRVGTLELKNADHKYSPPNGSSPLTGNLKPGRPVWIKAWYPFDAFTGSANTALSAHTPDEDSDFAWVDPIANNFELDGSGAARTDSGAGGFYLAYLEFNDTDVTIACDFKRGTDTADHGGILLRYVDDSNYGHVRFANDTIKIFENVAGTHSQVATVAFTWADSTSKFVEVRVHGTEVRIFVDRVLKLTGTMDDAAFNAGTKHGLICDGIADHTWDNFGGYRSLFFGRIDKIRPRPKTGAKYCYIELVDEFELFKRDELTSINGDGDNTPADTSLTLILNNLDFATADRQLESATILQADLDEGLKALVSDALSTIYRLQEEEDGFIYVNTDGFVTLEKREHRSNAPHTVSRATYKDTYDGSNPRFIDLAWDDGIQAIENHVIVKFSRATKSASNVQLWRSKQAEDTTLAIPIDASETMDFIVEVQDYDAVFSWTTPVAITDYLVNTQADDDGTDKTSQVTVSFQNTGKILGKFRHLRVVNNDASAYFITLLKIRGIGLTNEDTMSMEATDSTSQTAVGERRHIIDCLFIDREQAAQDLATNRKDRRKDAKTQLLLTLAPGDKHTLRNMIQRRLSDRITVSYSDMGISEDFFIEGESWVIDQGGTMVEQQLQLRGV
jgi:hypothetical protein